MWGKLAGLMCAAVLLAVPWSDARAQGPRCEEPLGRLMSGQGRVELRPEGADRWRPLAVDALLCPGDVLHVGPQGRAGVYLTKTEGVMRVDRNTTLRLKRREERRSFLGLLEGAAHFFSRRARALDITTPFVNAGVEGTEFVVRVDEGETLISVFEGRVIASNDAGEVALDDGKTAVTVDGQAPELRDVVDPRGFVRWSLYYPPILALRPPEDAPVALRRASDAWAARDHEAAFVALDTVPAGARDVRFYVLRAALRLDVGQVDAARRNLDRAGDTGDALALRSVIAVTANNRDEALTQARRAVHFAPESPAARIALSYALQASARLAEARDVLARGAKDFPANGLVRARLAELRLAFGDSRGALTAADEAEALPPALARTATVRGFALLARFRVEAAKDAFRAAIDRDSAAPLPRLGLGLAKIRDGKLVEGRREMETAAALDPGNALVRSYLGKAYFEERREDPAAAELATAKRLDPRDPTAYYYDALRKQAENRPTEALDDIRAAVARNDNRAVYRSGLLLDEDRAVRGTSAARIYNDLGFERLAQLEASRSLASDPSNHSAHRFLADSFRGSARQDIVRASELLRAQLLQPLNVQPVQASRAETELNLPTRLGPVSPGLNEFTPFFARDGLRVSATGTAGSEDTLGDEFVVSGILGRTAFSASQFHFEDDGFRPNNDQNHDIYDVFGQVAVTPDISLQAEYRHRETEQGDLAMNFDPDDFDETQRRVENEETVRFGAHWAAAENFDLIGSFIYEDREAAQSQEIGPGILLADQSGLDGWDVQLQGIWRADNTSVVLGGSFSQIDNVNTEKVTILSSGLSDADLFESRIEQKNIYAYYNRNFRDNFHVTIGGSLDQFDSNSINEEQFNPKLAFVWTPWKSVKFRSGVFRTLKRFLSADQTLEPSQLAGVFQFFDDRNGESAWQYFSGIDVRFSDRIFAGLQYMYRDVDALAVSDNGTEQKQQDENHLSGYFYWIPIESVSVSLEPTLLDVDRPIRDGPRELRSLEMPLRVAKFFQGGAYTTVQATFVNQRLRSRTDQPTYKSESFAVLDGAIGYRFPDRRGSISFEVQNILNSKFNYQDLNFINAGRDVAPRFEPDRSLLLNLSVAF